MIVQILKHTPPWVFVLFLALLHLGYAQCKTRSVSKGRLAVLPLVMVGFSFYGVLSAFGTSMIGIGSWALAVVLTVLLSRILNEPKGVVYESASELFIIPGSWLPLGLMIAIFFTKYAVAVAFARIPSLRGTAIFIFITSLTYGLYSGMFFARTLHAWRAAQRVT